MARLKPITLPAITAVAMLVASTLWTTGSVADPEATLTIGWALAPPVFEIGPELDYTGYSVELARLLGEAVEHDVQIRTYDSISALAEAQISGETDMLAGAPDFDIFRQTGVLSQPVGNSRYVLFALASRLDSLNTAVDGSLRVSVMPGRPPEVDDYMAHQIEVPISSPGEGLLALLSRDIDAVLFPEETVHTWTYRAGLDHLVLPSREPVAEVQRVVVLHQSRSDLLPLINAAIQRLEADGSLPELRRRYLMEHFEPEPDVLTVGIPHIGNGVDLAPYYLLQEDGDYTGFAIELFQKLAASAGLRYRFKVISFADMAQGPTASGVDIVPLFALATDSHGLADYTLPTEELLITATVRANGSMDIQSLEDLSGHRVGVIGDTFAHKMALRNETLSVTTHEPGDHLLNALLEGSVDVILEGKGYTTSIAQRRGLSESVQELSTELFHSERGILLRFGLGEVRERLNMAIGSYLLSDDYATLKQKYFGAHVFWTTGRQQIAFASLAAAAMLILAFGSALVMSDRARRRATAAHGEAKLAHHVAERARREAETSRRQAEDRAAETLDATSQLRAVMDAAQSGILGMNRDGKIVIANPVARAMIGAEDRSDSIDWPRDISFFQVNRSQAQALTGKQHPVNRALAEDHLAGDVFLMSGATDAELRSVRLASTSLPREASPEIGTVLVIDDVTEQERDRIRVERYDRLSMVGQLTGGVAHDFNNLLAVILSRQELLRDDISDKALLRHIDASIGAASRGAELTRSMLAFARKAPLQPRKLDVNEMVNETREWTERTIASNITVETALMEGLWSIEVDPGAAESALLNLILIARDAMPDGGTLTIATSHVEISEDASGLPDTIQSGHYVVLSVTDTGQGISAENLTRIFEPFFTTKAPGQGSGLGLSMIQGFMEQSGGGATVSSETGKGTNFQLYFPARTAASATAKEVHSRPSARMSPEPSSHRILLVEDNTGVLAVLDTILNNAGYAVTTAKSADQALAIIESDSHFDLLLTDVMMPGRLNGADLATILRERAPELPVITMSGYTDAGAADEMTGSASVQLAKPVSRSDLLHAINEALDNSLAVSG